MKIVQNYVPKIGHCNITIKNDLVLSKSNLITCNTVQYIFIYLH